MGLENNHVEQEKGVRRPTEILSKVVTGDIIEKMTFGHELEAGGHELDIQGDSFPS